MNRSSTLYSFNSSDTVFFSELLSVALKSFCVQISLELHSKRSYISQNSFPFPNNPYIHFIFIIWLYHKAVNIATASHQITPKACLSTATCCGMESSQSYVWNHGNAVYGINPKVVTLNTRFERYHARLRRNSMQRASALITYQSFGLDKKIPRTMFSEFFCDTTTK